MMTFLMERISLVSAPILLLGILGTTGCGGAIQGALAKSLQPSPGPSAAEPTPGQTEPASKALTTPLVADQPEALPSVDGFTGSVTYDPSGGSSFAGNPTVTIRTFIGAPLGAPAPQQRRLVSATPQAVATVQYDFSASESFTFVLTATSPDITPGVSYSAETFDASSGALLAVAQAPGSNGGSVTFPVTGPVTGSATNTYETLIVTNSALTPTPELSPTATT